MTNKRKGPLPRGASSNTEGNLTCKKANTGYLDSQQNLERYEGLATDPAVLRELKTHVRALELANRERRAAGHFPVDFKFVCGKWVAYEDPSQKTMGEMVEREGRRALRFWEGKPVPKFQPWSDWVRSMTQEVDEPVPAWRADSAWTAVARAVQWVRSELKIVCLLGEWERPGAEWRARLKMERLLASAREVAARG
jgi:hypothetical protein